MPGFRPPEIPTVEELVAKNSYMTLSDMAVEAQAGFAFRMRALKVCGFLLGAAYGVTLIIYAEKIGSSTMGVMLASAVSYAMLCWIAYVRQKEICDNVVAARNRKRHSLPAETERR